MSAPAVRNYKALFCEENIYQLLHDPCLAAAGHTPREVWIISNPNGRVATWEQRASPDPAHPVVWDYHAALLSRDDASCQLHVWDLDHRGPCPRPALDWLMASFSPFIQGSAPAQFAPHFRRIPAARYREQFSSDRRHMRTASGEWNSEPPPWPPIVSAAAPMGDQLVRWLKFEPESTKAWTSLGALHTLVRT